MRKQAELYNMKENAENLSTHILLVGEWVWQQGGIYTKNPEAPEDELFTHRGSYGFLSSLSTFSQDELRHGFRLISLNPKNSKNLPDLREENVLIRLNNEQMLPEYYIYQNGDGIYWYRYIKPIKTKEVCLKCHGEKGFQEGEILGALSISLPFHTQMEELQRLQVMFFILGTLILVGTTLILYLVIGKIFLDPFHVVLQNIQEAAAGNWSYRSTLRTGDEWDELSKAYNFMASTIEKELQKNEKNFIETIQSISSALDARDPYTMGHSTNVAKVSRVIATELGLSEQELNSLEISAILHDIGKIGIPDDVLNKPDQLSDKDWLIIKNHPLLGAKILQPIETLNNNPGVLFHHERYDGYGYPHGLKGESIPLVARIIAVADSYDAMVSNRVYRKPLSHQDAVTILTNNSRTQFCPLVIATFLKCLPVIVSIYKDYT